MPGHTTEEIFLDYVVRAMVENPGDVKIVRKVDEMGVLLTLTVNAKDMGVLIGRSGGNAKAIRTILRVVGMKHDARVNMKIEEPEGSTYQATGKDATVDEMIDELKQ